MRVKPQQRYTLYVLPVALATTAFSYIKTILLDFTLYIV